nr:immunoglobulin heavy chain junction region [Macaca mulatta]MOW25669.1 immunoglobulin heavy chain junction region [Macaca mulatta]
CTRLSYSGSYKGLGPRFDVW